MNVCTQRESDVLVVGAGPSGLVAACELLRRGVRVRIIDKRRERTTSPRALALWPPALRILADVGIGEEIRGASTEITSFRYLSTGRTVATVAFGARDASRTLPQHEIERLLTERLHALGGVVERGVELCDIERADDSESGRRVTAILRRPGENREGASAEFVVGSDGASGVVRGLIGAEFRGSTYPQTFALLDAKVTGELPEHEIRYYQSRQGTLVVVPAPGGVFRFLSVLPDSGDSVSVPMMQRIIDERGPAGVRITEPVWQADFRVHARQASRFRRGRVFLAGDAAHVHSPAGGQGMNNGLQDSHALAWRLAAVLNGDAGMSLLADYEPERMAMTRRIVRDTDLHTRAWVVEGRARVFVRDALFRLADRCGLADRCVPPLLSGRGLTYPAPRASQWPSGTSPCRLRRRARPGALFPGGAGAGPRHDPSSWTVTVVASRGRGSGRLDDVTAIANRWRDRVIVTPMRRRDAATVLGCARGGYYLTRPDGRIVAHGHERDLDRLEAELELALGAPVGRTPAGKRPERVET